MYGPVDAFGQLRAWMQERELSPQEMGQLWDTMWQMWHQDREQYEALWLPYIESFPGHWGKKLGDLQGLGALEIAQSIAPFGRFSLEMPWMYLGPEDVSTFCALLEDLPYVDELILAQNPIQSHGIRMIASSSIAPRLERLNVSHVVEYDTRLDDIGLRPLAKSERLGSLRVLDLSKNGIQEVGLEAMLSGEGLAGLESLNLAGNDLYSSDLEILAESDVLSNVRHLDISNMLPTWRDWTYDEGVLAVLTSEKLRGLESLNIKRLGVSSVEVWKGLAGHDSLKSLAVSGCGVSAIWGMMMDEGLSGVEVLDLSGGVFGQEGMTCLARANHLKNLKHLDLSKCRLNVTCLELMLEASWFEQLESLNMKENWLQGPEAAVRLAASPKVRSLRRLELTRGSIGNKGRQAILDSPWFHPLVKSHYY